ncbi:MAG: type I methionyl aminopeptidase [Candidatus Absconditabacteria bacterium]
MSLIKTAEQIHNIRESGKYLNELLLKLKNACKAGITLIELEFIAEDYMKKNNIKGAFKRYQGFPANLCLSVNDCIVHGIPDDTVLQNGDLLKIDCGINFKGGITDSAISIVIGGEYTNPLGQSLIKTTKAALDLAIQELQPGAPLINYGHTVSNRIHKDGFAIIEQLTGHGVGNKVHEDPHIYNYAHPAMKKVILQPGMVLAIEPITAVNSTQFVAKKGNDWNLYCKHGDLGCQREYTILITHSGYEILSGIIDPDRL